MQLFIKPSVSSLLTRISNFLTEQDIPSYVVGGFVRDVLLGRETADIDIAIMADALQVTPRLANAFCGRYIPLDLTNGVGRVVLSNSEELSTQNQWNLDFSTIKGTIEQDLARRDFTINAMAVDLKQLEKNPTDVSLIDPFNGWDDLNQKTLRAVSNIIFTTDAARLLRAVRLAAELGFNINKETEILIQSQSHLMSKVTGERIREELLRLLVISPSELLLPYLDQLGLITAIIPEMTQTKGIQQPGEHFWNVFDHSLKAVVTVDFLLRHGTWEYGDEEILAAVPWSEELARYFNLSVSSGSTRRSLIKLAALIHDVAKPQTKAIDNLGRMRFLGHATEGAMIATTVLEKLRFSVKEIRLVEALVKHHLRPSQITHDKLPSHRAIYRYFRDTGDAGVDILFLSLADHLATRGPNLIKTHWWRHTKIVDYVLTQRFEQEALIVPPRLINGHDLINILGMRPGPRIGEFLEQVREAQVSEELATREEALSYIREHLLSKAA